MNAYREYRHAKEDLIAAENWVALLDETSEGRPVYSPRLSDFALDLFPYRDQYSSVPQSFIDEIKEDIDIRALAKPALERLRKRVSELLVAAADDLKSMMAELNEASAK